GAPSVDPATGKKQVSVITPGGTHDANGQGYREAELRFLDKTRREMYARPQWWPYEKGAGLRAYGHVKLSETESPYVLVLPNDKGSIDVRKGQVRDNLPSELKANSPVVGRPGYYIVQLAPGQASKGSLAMRQAVESHGAKIIDYVPNNAYLVRIDGKNRTNFDDKGVFQYVTPYNAADKIHPTVGTKARLNPEYAVKDEFDLVVRVMDGENPDDVAADFERLGGNVTQTQEVAGARYVSGTLHNNRVIELARDPAVREIHEAPDYVLMNLTSSQQTEVGRQLDMREFGAILLPFRDAGV